MDIKEEFLALDKLIEDSENDFNEETGEFTDNTKEITELTKELVENRDSLVNYLVNKRDEYKMLESGIADKIRKLQDKKASAKRQQEKVLDTIDYILEGEKLKTDEFTIYYAKSESVAILDKSDIPQKFIEFTHKLSLSEIKKALKRGDKIKGAVLETKIGVRIR